MKVPITVSWLSENDLLVKAMEVKGTPVIKDSVRHEGFDCMDEDTKRPFTIAWDAFILFTTHELKKLGFE